MGKGKSDPQAPNQTAFVDMRELLHRWPVSRATVYRTIKRGELASGDSAIAGCAAAAARAQSAPLAPPPTSAQPLSLAYEQALSCSLWNSGCAQPAR